MTLPGWIGQGKTFEDPKAFASWVDTTPKAEVQQTAKAFGVDPEAFTGAYNVGKGTTFTPEVGAQWLGVETTDTPAESKYKPKPTPKAPQVNVVSTADTMTGLLRSDSPYMTAARQRGREYGASRGLLNTSIAGGAAERSAIEAALPIAQQDAAYSQSLGTIAAQEAASGRLSAQEAAQALGMSEAEYQQQVGLSGLESRQALELERVQQEGANLRQQAEIEANISMDAMQLGSQERTSLGSAITNLGESFSEQIANIQRDPNVDPDAKTAAIETLSNAYRANLESLMSVYGVSIDWTPLQNVPVAEPESEQGATQDVGSRDIYGGSNTGPGTEK